MFVLLNCVPGEGGAQDRRELFEADVERLQGGAGKGGGVAGGDVDEAAVVAGTWKGGCYDKVEERSSKELHTTSRLVGDWES